LRFPVCFLLEMVCGSRSSRLPGVRVQPKSASLGNPTTRQLGSSARLGTARLGAARLGAARLGSARLGVFSADPGPGVNDCTVTWLCLVAPTHISQINFRHLVSLWHGNVSWEGGYCQKIVRKGGRGEQHHWHQTSFVECNPLVHHEC